MYRHTVQNPPIKSLHGLLIVAGLVAVIWIDSLIAGLITRFSGLIAAIFFWGVGAAVALWTMRRFSLGYSYSLSSTVLRIAHLYGKRERPMQDIYLNNIVFSGTPDAVTGRYPSARVHRAVLPRNPAETFAVAYRDDGRIAIMLLQPDDRIKAELGKKR